MKFNELSKLRCAELKPMNIDELGISLKKLKKIIKRSKSLRLCYAYVPRSVEGVKIEREVLDKGALYSFLNRSIVVFGRNSVEDLYKYLHQQIVQWISKTVGQLMLSIDYEHSSLWYFIVLLPSGVKILSEKMLQNFESVDEALDFLVREAVSRRLDRIETVGFSYQLDGDYIRVRISCNFDDDFLRVSILDGLYLCYLIKSLRLAYVSP